MPTRPGNHVSPVHPTILVRLPRFGDQVGLIPDTPAGHLLHGRLAAFNQASYPALGNALPNVALTSAAAAQIELRRQTGGFILLSAEEVQPGVLVFRLRDQTPAAIESLGTLQLRPNSSPPPSRASDSAPSPHSARAPPRGLPHSQQPHRDESAIDRKPDPPTPRTSSHPPVGQFGFIRLNCAERELAAGAIADRKGVYEGLTFVARHNRFS